MRIDVSVMSENYYVEAERLSGLIDRYVREGRRMAQLRAQQTFNRHVAMHGDRKAWEEQQSASTAIH